ncbi:MAG: GWxTD domain-containing protein [Candidatus Aminicenantes bacterium]|nr:GWxTD domain-containing protein [Candidatus Aminicenantes bacterium]
MKKKILAFLVSVLLFCPLMGSVGKIKREDLPAQYREFLDLTQYIMLDEERDVFLQLTTSRERDIFIESFWKQRDPTPGTKRNEYREEHIKRFEYANEFLGRGTSREGWRTDRGRIYIILGEPASKEYFEGMKELYPVEVWYYYGGEGRGLPPHFAVVFFKRGGFGEYRLYDPVADGPTSLLIKGREMDFTDYRAAYEKIKQLAPTLSLVALSVVPGDIPFNFQPSPENNIIMAEIFESPKKDINPTYATNFMDYKGLVSTDYMTNYIENVSDVSIIRDPQVNLNFVHFSIVPQNLSVDYYEPNDQYFCNFELNVSLRKGEEIVFQYTKNYPYYFPPEDLEKVRASGVSVEDSFPLTEGRYELTALLKNSVGKEFTILEKSVEVKESSGSPEILGPFVGYSFREYERDLHIPYKVLNEKLVLDPSKTFSASDEIAFLFVVSNIDRSLWENGKMELAVQGLKEKNPASKSFSILLQGSPFQNVISFSHSVSAQELTPDYYRAEVKLLDGTQKVMDTQSVEFVISPNHSVGHPISFSKGFPLSNSFIYFYMLASQNRNLGNMDKAESYYKQAYQMNPDFQRGVLDYTSFLVENESYNQALDMAEKFKDIENLTFQYYLLKGKALMGLERYKDAIKNFLEGNKIYDSDTGLLNSLGFCYHKTDQNKKAMEVLNASLKLNPKQENVQNLIKEIEKKN